MPEPTPPERDDEDDKPSAEELIAENLIPAERLEHGLVGECLVSSNTPDNVPFLKPEHFWSETARAAWKGMIELRKHGCELDAQTVAEHLKRTAHVPYVDWENWLIRASNDPTPLNPLNFEHDARILFGYALRRKKIREHEQAISDLSDLTKPLAESGLASMAGVVHTAEEAFEDLPPVNWLVKSVLAPGSVVLLYGKPATKKTYCMYSLAVCVALGKAWAGFDTRRANVLIVDQESGDRRIKVRMRECINGVLGDKSAPVCWVTMKGYKLDNPEDRAKIKQILIERDIELVIVDSLSKVSNGDENSVQDMAKVMDGARELAFEPDTVVILIHHSQKTGEKYRGSSTIDASVDMMIRVESEEGSRFVNFAMEKNRDGELLRWSVRATWVQHEAAPEKDQFYVERVEGRKEEKREEEEEEEENFSVAEEFVLNYLGEHGESDKQEILAAPVGCTREMARKALYSLVQTGLVQRINSGAGGRHQHARYALVDQTQEEKTRGEAGQ